MKRSMLYFLAAVLLALNFAAPVSAWETGDQVPVSFVCRGEVTIDMLIEADEVSKEKVFGVFKILRETNLCLPVQLTLVPLGKLHKEYLDFNNEVSQAFLIAGTENMYILVLSVPPNPTGEPDTHETHAHAGQIEVKHI